MIIFNPSDTAVVYSEQGHIIGGGERQEVEKLDKHGQRAVEHGYIVIKDEDSGDETTDESGTAEADESEKTPPSKSGGRKRSTTVKNDEDSGDSGASNEPGGN